MDNQSYRWHRLCGCWISENCHLHLQVFLAEVFIVLPFRNQLLRRKIFRDYLTTSQNDVSFYWKILTVQELYNGRKALEAVEAESYIKRTWCRALLWNAQRPIQLTESAVATRISVSGILSAIEVVVSHEGCVPIMTTNHPENLDNTFLRRGRVDMQIQFKRRRNSRLKISSCRFFRQRQYRVVELRKWLERCKQRSAKCSKQCHTK